MVSREYDLPQVSGEIRYDVNMDKFSYFGTGGTADVLFTPTDNDDLVYFLREKPRDMPVTVIGAGSNLLVRDGGVRGVVIKLGQCFDNIYINEETIEVGAAVQLPRLANKAADSGIAKLEFLAGIPGSVGGALLMNAGCHGSCMSDIFVEAESIDYDGNVRWISKSSAEFDYRSSNIKDVIVTRAWLKGEFCDSSVVAKNMYMLLAKRKNSQNVKYRSCGSAFKNPENCEHKAWQLIDQAGCRGLRVGGAMVSDVHCNFIVNTGNATATEIEELGEEVIRRVQKHSGVTLEWEIKRIGEKI